MDRTTDGPSRTVGKKVLHGPSKGKLIGTVGRKNIMYIRALIPTDRKTWSSRSILSFWLPSYSCLQSILVQPFGLPVLLVHLVKVSPTLCYCLYPQSDGIESLYLHCTHLNYTAGTTRTLETQSQPSVYSGRGPLASHRQRAP